MWCCGVVGRDGVVLMESERVESETSGGRSAEWFRFFGAARQEQKKGQPQRQRQWQRTLT